MKKIFTFILVLVLSCGVSDARKVSGTVTCGETGLSGVLVTDGQTFTQTKKNGKFVFDIADDAEFVYIITPSGFAADWSDGVPAFYQKAEGKKSFVFELKGIGQGYDYNLIAVGDPQPRTEENFETFAGMPLDDLSMTAKSLGNMTVGVALGDICWDVLPLLDSWKNEIVRTGIPFYPVVGNHDHDKDIDTDYESTSPYRAVMGPENYAFWMGKDLVIALDNIIYKGKGSYNEGYAEHVLAFMKGLMNHVPEGTTLFIAQHSPFGGRSYKEKIVNSEKLLDLIKGHEVRFISGHNHVSRHVEYEKGITEQNIASICGTWWEAYHCTDGTPRGYKVFTKKNGRLSWYYKSVGHDKDFQFEVFNLGQAPMHPNSVVVNVWDYDPEWKLEWYEDGKPMGRLDQIMEYSPAHIAEMKAVYLPLGKKPSNYKRTKKAGHYFAATPSQYAKNVTIAIESRFGQKWVVPVKLEYVDVQAHRGGAGLMPENTIAAMKHALDMGVNTLELDLQVSKDGQIVVSHDAYFHSRYAIRPDGTEVKKDDPKEYLYNMDYEQIARYDVGSRKSEVWPQKEQIRQIKPLASDLIDFVESYTKEKGYSPVRYNIEIKSKMGKGEGASWMVYHDFVDVCVKLLLSKHLDERLVVQSFDTRALNFMNEKYPELHLSYLVDKKEPDFDKFMEKLKFTPEWLSPHFSITDETLVKKCHDQGIRVVPWTVDEQADIKRILDLKVDAIISNYPDRVLLQTRGY